MGNRAKPGYLFPMLIGVIPVVFEMYIYPSILVIIPILLVSMIVSLLIFISDRRHIEGLSLRLEKEDLIRIAGSLYKQVDSGKRFKNALAAAMEGIERSGSCYEILFMLMKDINSGMTVDNAVRRIIRKMKGTRSNTVRFIKNLDCSDYEMPKAGKIYAEYRRLIHEYEEDMERDSGSVQRYITMSMVMGTVFPSFILFGFIGYSIMNFGVGAISALLVGLVTIVPGAYAIVRSKLEGVYSV